MHEETSACDHLEERIRAGTGPTGLLERSEKGRVDIVVRHAISLEIELLAPSGRMRRIGRASIEGSLGSTVFHAKMHVDDRG